MKYPVFSIRDNKIGFGQPMVHMSEDVARRDFGMKINTPNTLFDFAPSDFDLFKIGSFDTESGMLEPCAPPEFVCNGKSVYGDSYGEIRR